MKSTGIIFAKRPTGIPTLDCFSQQESLLPALNDGQILIKNNFLSVDPYMRGRMSDTKSYVPPFQLGELLQGAAIGEVVESKNTQFAVGDIVSSMLGWREYAISDGNMVQKLPKSAIPAQAYLSIAGMPGLTAWVGLYKIAELKEGETVFVSAASGAVGSLVCQFAKLKKCRVIASVGNDEKADWLKSLGVDAVVNYKKSTNLQKDIAQHCPNGIDVYYENVGGEHLEVALNLMNRYGRIAACGMISLYNNEQPGPNNLTEIVKKSLTIKGFIISDHWHHYNEYISELSELIAQEKITWKETTYQGISSMPKAFIDLFDGNNIGKAIISL